MEEDAVIDANWVDHSFEYIRLRVKWPVCVPPFATPFLAEARRGPLAIRVRSCCGICGRK